MHNKYIVTYATQHSQYLDGDFVLVEVRAHNERDANILMSNIEKLFDGVVIECEQEVRQTRKKKRVNSDRRKL